MIVDVASNIFNSETVVTEGPVVLNNFISSRRIFLATAPEHEAESPLGNGFPYLANQTATLKFILVEASFSLIFCEEILLIKYFKFPNFFDSCFVVSRKIIMSA